MYTVDQNDVLWGAMLWYRFKNQNLYLLQIFKT